MPALLELRSSTADDLEMLCAADYPATDVQWLWPGRIPVGKVTLLVGDPGSGKSLVALDVAARVTRGGAWPDEKVESQATRAESQRKPSGSRLSALDSRLPGSVLVLSAADDIRDTIRPRLDAAGADPRHVFVMPKVADLRHDLDKLRAALDRLPDCRLIVIDPVNSYVGPGDSHFHTIVRRVFEPLAKLAAEREIAILAVSHLRKHDGAAIQRAAGSMGFVAAASAVWTVCRDPVQPGRYLMLQVKNNFVAETAGLAYTISSAASGLLDEPSNEHVSAPAVAWQTESVTTSAVEALQPTKGARGPEPAELRLAMDFVERELVTGPKAAEWMYAEAIGGGFCDRTIRRALVALGGATQKVSFGGPATWVWCLPGHDFKRPQSEPTRSEASEPADNAPSPADREVADSAAGDPSENLSTSPNPEEFVQETCPPRPNQPASEPLLPDPFGDIFLFRTDPSDPTEATPKSWSARTCALLTAKRPEGCFVPYEHHLAQTKVMRIWKSRCRLGNRRKRLKPVDIDLVKPFAFRHPERCRAP